MRSWLCSFRRGVQLSLIGLMALICLAAHSQLGSFSDDDSIGLDDGSIGLDDDPIAEFRRSLADPARYPIRKSGRIDSSLFEQAIDRFIDENQIMLADRFRESIAGIEKVSEGELPIESDYESVGMVTEEFLETSKKTTRSFYAIYPDVRRLAMITVMSFLPIALREKGLMSLEQLGNWIGFFAYSLPEWRVVEATDEELLLFADYGRIDLVIVLFLWRDSVWTPAFINWVRSKG